MSRRLWFARVNALVIIALLVLGMVAVGVYAVYRAVNTVKILPWLSEEIGPYPVLTSYTVGELKPGMVFTVTPDIHGWQVREKETTLYEKLVLEGVDISFGDVIAPHLYDFVVTSAGNPSNKYDSAGIYFRNQTNDYLVLPPDVTIVWLGYFRYAEGFYSTQAFCWGFYTYQAHWGLSLYYGNSYNVGTNYRAIGFKYVPYSASYVEEYMLHWLWKDYIDANNTVITYYREDGISKQQSYDVSSIAPNRFADGKIPVYAPPNHGSHGVSIFNRERAAGDPTTGRIAFLAAYSGLITPKLGDGTGLLFLADATFYNGTHWLAFTRKTDGTILPPYISQSVRYVVRVPTQRPFLWHLDSFETDGKLHFKWFPSGTIIVIKDSSGNVVRKFTITGDLVNEDGQVLDYSIPLDQTTIPNATIIAYVPSLKVRVYAPYGSIVRIVNGTMVLGEKEVGVSGYVDIALSKTIADGQIVVAAKDYVEDKLDIQVDEKEDGTIEVTVMDENGVLVPGMLVRIADPSGVVIYAAVTDQSGRVVFVPDRPLPEITVEVSGVWNGAIHYTTKTFQLSASVEAATVSTVSASTSSTAKWLILGIGLVALLAIVVAVRKR